ncbi:hypothetical protein H632_c1460p1, partial [Helicosporidium sp. ATCC 50920]
EWDLSAPSVSLDAYIGAVAPSLGLTWLTALIVSRKARERISGLRKDLASGALRARPHPRPPSLPSQKRSRYPCVVLAESLKAKLERVAAEGAPQSAGPAAAREGPPPEGAPALEGARAEVSGLMPATSGLGEQELEGAGPLEEGDVLERLAEEVSVLVGMEESQAAPGGEESEEDLEEEDEEMEEEEDEEEEEEEEEDEEHVQDEEDALYRGLSEEGFLGEEGFM